MQPKSGNPLTWCSTCEGYLPRHTCEWKVLVTIVLGAGVVSVAGLLAMLWAR
jgi:hypothetical protein